MIDLTIPNNRIIVDNANTLWLTNRNKQIELLASIIPIINTTTPMLSTLGKSIVYWDYMKDVINYITTGKWQCYPTMWATYCCSSKDDDLVPIQVQKYYDDYLQHRKDQLQKVGLSHYIDKDRHVILKCLMNAGGEKQLIDASQALLVMYLGFTKTTLGGEEIKPKGNLGTFNNANVAARTTVGITKQEVLKYQQDNS